MESDRINFLLNNPSEAVLDDIYMLEQEIAKYPYAQILHVLLAKIKFQQNSEDKNKKLTAAAIYSSDRSILKKAILENGYLENYEEIVPFQDLPKFELEESSDDINSIYNENEESDSSTIFNEVLRNLEKLKSLRKQFQFLELSDESVPIKKESEEQTANKKSDITTKEIKKNPSENTVTHKPIPKKKQYKEILEKDEILDSQVNVFFLKEIEEKKKSLQQDESDKYVTQSKIIEKFIAEQPSIGSLKKEEEKALDIVNKDLSEKSTNFGDDLISENLAIILFKQGKRERAIDIYKKLIWKLPQKKAYFAARIEEIKK